MFSSNETPTVPIRHSGWLRELFLLSVISVHQYQVRYHSTELSDWLVATLKKMLKLLFTGLGDLVHESWKKLKSHIRGQGRHTLTPRIMCEDWKETLS